MKMNPLGRTGLMEPALLLLLAGLVLFIFMALVVPMMQMGSDL